MDRGRARGLSALPPPPFTNSALLRVCDKHASVKINARNLLNLTQKTVLAINSENFTPNTKGDLITTISYFFENDWETQPLLNAGEEISSQVLL